ncbi:MAG: hypothetical protein ACRBB0_15345 [Pelagimonas sp.]|uniref:hypothetical protein n=1 Tax=Pelagimonas sp. TaxID=2073170 RepID=UPI003D6BF07F
MPLDHTSGGSEIALHTYRPDPFPDTLDLPRVEPSARALVAKMGAEELRRQAQERLTERRWGSRFTKMWVIYHAKNAPMLTPIALLAVIAAGAVLKITYGG